MSNAMTRNCFELLESKDPLIGHNSYLDSSNPVPLRTYLQVEV